MSFEPPLPGVLAEIAEVAGRETAIAIARAWGGRQVHVPVRLAETGIGRELAGAVGRDAAQAVMQRFAGESLYVPMARRAVVGHLSASGMSAAAIAAQLGVSIKTVRRYRRAVQGTMVP